jgi:hypothetical protein
MTPTEQQNLGVWLWTLTDWILAHKGRNCLRLATRENLFRYVAFAHLHGRIAVARDAQGQIEAVMFYWCDFKERIEAKAENGVNQFEWTANHPGDALFVAEIIGSHEGVARIIRTAFEKWPHLMTLPIYSFRRGKLVLLSMAKINHFIDSKIW